MSRSALLPGLAALLFAAVFPATAAAAIELVSVSSAGTLANAESRYPAISADGRYVVFRSAANNLVAGDTNGLRDLFVRDRLLGTTTRINLKPGGGQTVDQDVDPGEISGDGQRIVFRSREALLPGVAKGRCYLLDRAAQSLTVLDTLANGQPATGTCEAPTIDRAGRRVAFRSNVALLPGDAVNAFDIYVRDLPSATITRINRRPDGGLPDGGVSNPRISAAGSHVLFFSHATDLVAGDTNAAIDLFLARADGTGPITRESVGPGGGQLVDPSYASFTAALNADASLLAFDNMSPSLPWGGEPVESNLYLRLPGANLTALVSSWVDDGWAREPDFDASGRWLVFIATDELYPGAGSGVHVVDLKHGTAAYVGPSGKRDGHAGQPRISADGSGIVWYTSDKLIPEDTNTAATIYYADNPLWDDTIFSGDFECGAAWFPPTWCQP